MRRHPFEWLRSTRGDEVAEISLEDALVLGQIFAFQNGAAELNHVAALGELQGRAGILLAQQGRAALSIQSHDDLEYARCDQRRETERRLVEQHELRTRHERPPNDEHLLSATQKGA